MQADGVCKGVSDKSLLFHSLKVYLDNKNRLQPIIGLGSVTECVKAGTHGREVLYLCEVCACRVNKADIRNHIMGSLHRYNYINTWHPHFVAEWKGNPDLSKLAWPLMEMAKILERREGPGDVEVLKLEEAVYQEMATCSETDAITMLIAIRHGQGQSETQSDTTSEQLEDCTIQPHNRVVLPPKKHLGQSKKRTVQPPRAVMQLRPTPSIQPTAAPSVKLEGRQNTSVDLHLGNNWESHEASVQSENSFLDGYTGITPLIGLDCVVECRSEEDGHAYCFLCHCCRIKSVKDDIIDHLTSSSHLFNYMMEVHPEQADVMMAGINGNSQLLQSLAEKVEQEEGRGELKPPLMRSEERCVKMLSNANGCRQTNIQKRKTAVKGPSVGDMEASDQGMPHKRLLKRTHVAKKKKKRIGNVTDPVFKVSLPLTEGSLVLKRTSFSRDHVPVSPTAEPALSPSPEPQTEVSELAWLMERGPESEHTTSVHTTSQPQPDDFSSGDADIHTNAQYPGQERHFKDTRYEEVDGGFSRSQCFNESENTTVTDSYEQRIIRKPQATFETETRPTRDSSLYEKQDWTGLADCLGSEEQNAEEWSNSRRCHTQGYFQGWQNEGLDREDQRLTAGVHDAQNWSTYNSYHRAEEEGYTEEQHSSYIQTVVGLRVDVPRGRGQREMSSDILAYQQYYKHQPQQQYSAQDYASLPTDSVGRHGAMAPSGIHGSNMDPHLEYSTAHSGGVTAESRMQVCEMEQRGSWTSGYMQQSSGYVQTAPHGHMTQPMVYPAFHGEDYGVTSGPYYNDGPGPDLYLPQPSTYADGLQSQPHMSLLPGQSQVYGTNYHSNPFPSEVGNGLSVCREPSPYAITYLSPSPGPAVPNHAQMSQYF